MYLWSVIAWNCYTIYSSKQTKYPTIRKLMGILLGSLVVNSSLIYSKQVRTYVHTCIHRRIGELNTTIDSGEIDFKLGFATHATPIKEAGTRLGKHLCLPGTRNEY